MVIKIAIIPIAENFERNCILGTHESGPMSNTVHTESKSGLPVVKGVPPIKATTASAKEKKHKSVNGEQVQYTKNIRLFL